MSWSYSGDPSTSDRDRVRFLIGDTDADNPQLQDEEIDALIAEHPGRNMFLAAAEAAECIASKYAAKIDHQAGPVSLSYSQLYQKYRDLAASLRRRLRDIKTSKTVAGPIFVTGPKSGSRAFT